MLLIATFLLMSALLASAVMSPRRFVQLALWTLSVPYWWNFDWQTSFQTPVGQLNILSIQVFGLCFACAVALMARTVFPGRQPGWATPHLAFVAFCALSIAWAASPAFGWRMLAKLAAPLLFLWVAIGAAGNRDDADGMRSALVGNGLLILALALVARALGINSDPNAVLTGEVGLGPPGMGPPVFSAHMLPVAMVALGAYLESRRRAWLLLLLACSIAVLAAHQRTSAVALYLGCAAILFVGTRGWLRVLMPLAGLAGLPLLFLLNESFRRRMFFGNADAGQILADPSAALSHVNGSGRFGLWQEVLDRFFHPHPASGAGLGATQQFLYASQGGAGVVHSEYVRLLCETGVVGLALFLATAASYLVTLARRAAPGKGGEVRGYVLAALGSYVAMLVFMSTDNGFDYVGQLGISVFVLVGISMRLARDAAAAKSTGTPVGPAALAFPNLMH